MNPCETSGNGAHGQFLVVYLQGMGDGHAKGRHPCGSAIALVLPEIYVHAYCFRRGTSAQGSGDQQKLVSGGGCVRHDYLISKHPLVDSAGRQTTYLEDPGAPSCSWAEICVRSSGSLASPLQRSGEMWNLRAHSVPESFFAGRELVDPKWTRGFWCCSNRRQNHRYEGYGPPNQGVMVPLPSPLSYCVGHDHGR